MAEKNDSKQRMIRMIPMAKPSVRYIFITIICISTIRQYEYKHIHTNSYIWACHIYFDHFDGVFAIKQNQNMIGTLPTLYIHTYISFVRKSHGAKLSRNISWLEHFIALNFCTRSWAPVLWGHENWKQLSFILYHLSVSILYSFQKYTHTAALVLSNN